MMTFEDEENKQINSSRKIISISWPWLECKWQKSALNVRPTDSNLVVYNTPQVTGLNKSLLRFFSKKNKLVGQPTKLLVY